MLKIGITGGIGAGKSVVCKILSEWGIPIFYADSRAKIIIDTDKSVKQKIQNIFGKYVFNLSGTLNNENLAKIVFNDKTSLEKLNKIVHPLVKEDFQKWAEGQNSPYVVEEAAILFESGSYRMMDKTIMIYCEKEIRIERIIKRNRFTREKIERIMSNQMDDEEKCKKADYVVLNNEKTLLLPQLLKIHNELISIV